MGKGRGGRGKRGEEPSSKWREDKGGGVVKGEGKRVEGGGRQGKERDEKKGGPCPPTVSSNNVHKGYAGPLDKGHQMSV